MRWKMQHIPPLNHFETIRYDAGFISIYSKNTVLHIVLGCQVIGGYQQPEVHRVHWRNMCGLASHVTDNSTVCWETPVADPLNMHRPAHVIMMIADVLANSAPGHNIHHVDDIFKCIFLNVNVRILLKISLNFVPKIPANWQHSDNGQATSHYRKQWWLVSG